MANPPSAAVNPFAMPPEAELFWLHNTEQRKSEAKKAEQRDLRVWDKATSASRRCVTKPVRDEDLPMAPVPQRVQAALENTKANARADETPDETFLTQVATRPAVGLLEPLRKNEKDIRSYVEKKREMFLVQMGLDVKKAEIIRLDEKARMKEEALTKSQQQLDEDARRFEDFLQEMYAKAQKTMKDAESHAKRKQDKLQRIKQLRLQISGVHSEISKFRETREECTKYKLFLEKLTPSEWKENQREQKATRKEKRREHWIAERMAAVLEKVREEELLLPERAVNAADESGGAEATDKRRRGGKQKRKEEEDERIAKEKDRAARKRRLHKRREEEEKRIAAEFHESSSEEEFELYFKEPRQLMDTFTELEEKNLFLIQSSQETEQLLDELQQNFQQTKRDLESKVRQLKENIHQLEGHIAQERRRGEELRRSYDEKAGTQAQDRKLADLAQKVQDVYLRCGLSMDHDPDTLQMLGAIEAKLEELIHGLEDAFHQDSALVMKLEWQKEKDRRDRVRVQKVKEQNEKQEERLKNSLLRSQAPVFKKAGKQVMYRSPPLRQERRVVKDSSEDEANAKDHSLFGIFIEKRTAMPQTEPPIVEDGKRASAARARAMRQQAAASTATAAASGGEGSNAAEGAEGADAGGDAATGAGGGAAADLVAAAAASAGADAVAAAEVVGAVS